MIHWIKYRWRWYIVFIIVHFLAFWLSMWGTYPNPEFFYYSLIHHGFVVAYLVFFSYYLVRLLLYRGHFGAFIASVFGVIVFSGFVAYFCYPRVGPEIINYPNFLANRLNLFAIPTIMELFFLNQQVQRKLENVRIRQSLIQHNQQTTPHLLFNALQVLHQHIREKSEKSEEILLLITDFLRTSLPHSTSIQISLEQELQLIESYIAMERLQGLAGDFQLRIQGSAKGQQIPMLLLLVWVENAFKYSLIRSSPEAYIHIAISIEEKQLFFEVENSKASHINPPKGMKVGSSNSQKRLDIFYQNRYYLQQDESDTTYKIILHLPLK